ncbi:MAG TPA: tyrosine-type recombinase/integrase [Oligoflexia bacterium]|nr:tyrosine-type recombinase/integrase [Oligoflexia bacterium]HMR25368.1 tyrosine-type recombinase/integrase [Oligoflexia bacterium]
MAKPIKRNNKWHIRWVDENGKRRGQSFKNYDTARKALLKNQLEVDQIKAGLYVRPKMERTFVELADYWMMHRASKKKNPKDDQSILNAHLMPFFGTLTLSQITLTIVDRFTSITLNKASAKTVNNHLTLLIAMLNMAIDLKWIDDKPKIKKLKIAQKSFLYLKTQNEIDRLLRSAKQENTPVPYVLYATAVYTGMRAGELAALKWQDVELIGINPKIHISKSYSTTTKSGKTRHVLILNCLQSILKEWKLQNPLPLVFPNAYGNMLIESSRIFQETFQRCIRRAGLERIRFHDLRHTFASHWMMKGGDIYKLKDLLGHSTVKMTERYAHLDVKAFDGDYDRFGKSIHKSKNPVISLNKK